ncbi:small basic protein [Goose calicivirus]|uniref:small basic protein n=1 Tax=Goose calicivirus TaxID=1493858 RepID=UPI0004586012|nr:small basic protein [Goose calicivirus]AHY39268.1 small basic protein [Goose calicivirus]
MATAIAAIGAGSQAASSATGLAGTIGDLVYRGQELALSREALKEQVKFNQQSLQLAASMPFIQADASAYATQAVTNAKLNVLRDLGASQSTLAAVAAGQNGVYINGNFQPIHYDQSYRVFNNSNSRYVSQPSFGGMSFPSTTVNKTVTNNNNTTVNKTFNRQQGSAGNSQNSARGNAALSATSNNRAGSTYGTSRSYDSAVSGTSGHYSVNSSKSSNWSGWSGNSGRYDLTAANQAGTASTGSPLNTWGSSSSTSSALNNWYQFGFLAPGGTRL